MTSLLDLWRAVDPEARLVSGSVARLAAPARGVLRTRAAAPHLPPAIDGELLVVEASLIRGRPLDALLATFEAAGLRPVGVVIAGLAGQPRLEAAESPLPILGSVRAAALLADAFATYVSDEAGHLQRLSGELRLAAAEAALADPDPAAPAGLVAARMRRGVAVVADGELRALHPRTAGRALAARFAATHARLLAGGGSRSDSSRRTRDGLWLLERRVRPGAAAWLFDDLPFARVDEVAADALGVTLRALLRRPPAPRPASRPVQRAAEAAVTDRFAATLLAVARSNGRIAPAARALGVHRNTVLYRLRAARAERGIDPRRPEDALRLLAEAQRRGA
ncbi:MAG TPA: helix-turn-helix domain-containing protein [Methylomirabilota bacterium]|nr:helix-turn-helix domain-containing protein [Methylomirabilota bacterium]